VVDSPILSISQHRALTLTAERSIPHPSAPVLLSSPPSEQAPSRSTQRPSHDLQPCGPAAGAELATGGDTLRKLVGSRRRASGRIGRGAELIRPKLGAARPAGVAIPAGMAARGTSQARSPGAAADRAARVPAFLRGADQPQPGDGRPIGPRRRDPISRSAGPRGRNLMGPIEQLGEAAPDQAARCAGPASGRQAKPAG